MKELPNGWAVVKLGNLLESIVGGSTPSKANSSNFRGSIPFMTVKDMTERFPNKTVDKISKEALLKMPSGLAPKDSLIISVRMSLGKIVRPRFATAFNQDLKVLNVKKGINKTYIEYFWRSKWNEIQLLGTGTTVKGIRLDDIRNFEVPLPPYAEQLRITEKLDSILELAGRSRERLNRIPGILNRYRQAVLEAATRGSLSAKWRKNNIRIFDWTEVELGSVVEDFSYGTSSKSEKKGDIPVLRMGNIQQGKLNWDQLVFTSDPVEIEKYKLSSGDVLFNRTNSPELVGKTAVYKGERAAIYAGYLIRIRCGDALDPEYLNYCLGSPQGRDFCWQVKADGVSQSNINAKKLAGFKFCLPPLDEQIEICRRVKILLDFGENIESRYKATLDRLDKLIPSLLSKAFGGGLLPQNEKDEPAEILLAGIESYYASVSDVPKESSYQKRKKMKSTKESLKEIIDQQSSEKFTFADLLESSGYDYESLKELVFDFLDSDSPPIRQIFDTVSREIRLERI
ncbi:restriction endonuclease subunit S [Pseudoduganella namucuonensis]|uniref:Type I restriction enzyme, S subunit n=1 Tax=Pseudoduganella namucuonensis TaxID=1035707 RepID=A0A1I7M3M5_9BURK|nr:restriction endonuclease subunit S [Pseudoduganella namucuonensis]SFV16552.1 type I restriction enzyme, S subunit [Pseudoduganella namucuonensis]